MQNGEVGNDGSEHYHCEQGGGPAAEFRNEQPHRASHFKNAGEIAKPLPDADAVEFFHHVRSADQLHTAYHQKDKREQEAENPAYDGSGQRRLRLSGGCFCVCHSSTVLPYTREMLSIIL